MTIELTSPAFQDGGFIPVRYTMLGEDISPPLEWKNVPEGTKTFALVLDETARGVNGRVHWIVFDIPADMGELPEHLAPQQRLPNGPYRIKQGRNEFDKIGYTGPVGAREAPHRYTFTIYALDSVIHLPPGATREELLGSMYGHILDEGRLTGLFSE